MYSRYVLGFTVTIEKAQKQVSKIKKAYDTAIANLSNLLDERGAIRRDELVKAIMKSNKIYDEEVMAFLNTGKVGKR